MVWIVERFSNGRDFEPARVTVVGEFSSEQAAQDYCRSMDRDKGMFDTTWHRARQANKSVSYY